ncbi:MULTISPECIES: hypothetical protein [unclassified Streptomyces]|uniref:hypothetical protein n=1 Tax=unclassified Streptomyces TaxID=2593676 RepID=UPI00131F20D6|nr:hypothetical protein [Streptomyces sp. 303MFCol5.2]
MALQRRLRSLDLAQVLVEAEVNLLEEPVIGARVHQVGPEDRLAPKPDPDGQPVRPWPGLLLGRHIHRARHIGRVERSARAEQPARIEAGRSAVAARDDVEAIGEEVRMNGSARDLRHRIRLLGLTGEDRWSDPHRPGHRY